ncbi:hypothetical protein KP509_24G059300 [Ceratopteris richardii]|uniref:SHSP domain-containing protein n=1 Tax=Ceratopteris richardii TaxID=49495 RepID=A0A8T2RXT2_CERRI|nr:hypothetical protein KP509_24G059300 [Ceratopteris richardii]
MSTQFSSRNGDDLYGQACPQPKQLRRLPHVFCKWVELPFKENADVKVEESPHGYRFLVRQAGLIAEDVVVEAVEVMPGATRLRLRGEERIRQRLKLLRKEASGSDSEDRTTWRARLPESALLEAAASSYINDVISINIPKEGSSRYRLSSTRKRPVPPTSGYRQAPAASPSCCDPHDIKSSLVCLV